MTTQDVTAALAVGGSRASSAIVCDGLVRPTTKAAAPA